VGISRALRSPNSHQGKWWHEGL